MTQTEIKNLFTVNYGMEKKPAPLPKKSFKFYFFCIIIVVIGWIVLAFDIIKRNKRKAEIDAWEKELNRRAVEYPKMYEKEVDKFVSDAEGIKAKGLKKTGLEPEQLISVAPVYFWGYNREKGIFTDVDKDGNVRRSAVDATYIFFTEDQIVVYTLTKNFFGKDGSEPSFKETTTEYFYKDVTNIRTSDESEDVTSVTGITKSVNYNTLNLVVPGDSYVMNVSSVDDEIEHSIQGMKALLRQKKMA